MKSTRYTWHLRDFLKGALMAFGTAFLTTLTQVLNSGELPTGGQLKISAIAGISAIIFYLLKNFFTDDVKVAEKVIVQAKEKEVKEAEKAIEKATNPQL